MKLDNTKKGHNTMTEKQSRMILQTTWSETIKRIDYFSTPADFIKPQEIAVAFDLADGRHQWEKSRVKVHFRVAAGIPPVTISATIGDDGGLAYNEPIDKEISKLCDRFYRQALTMPKTTEPDEANTFALNEMI